MRVYLFLLFSISLFSCSDEPAPKKYAIVYGISCYPISEFKLPYSSNDAESVKLLLEKDGYNVICRIDSSASLDTLVNDFTHVSKIIHPNDLFLFYFSGHGLSNKTMISFNDTTKNAQYFSVLLYNKNIEYPLDKYLNKSVLTIKKLNELFSVVGSKAKVAVVDACYSGLTLTDKAVVDVLPDNYDGTDIKHLSTSEIFNQACSNYMARMSRNGPTQNFLLLTSAGNDEVAWDGFFSHSVFTYFFLMAAEQGDLNSDGKITLLETYNYSMAAYQKYWNTPLRDNDWNYLPRISGKAVDVTVFSKKHAVDNSIINETN